MRSLKILIDMDDTLEDLLPAWVSCLNREFGTEVDPNEIREWDMRKAFPTLTVHQIYAPLRMADFWDTVYPKPGAREAVQRLMEDGHQVYVVTASGYEAIRDKMERVLFSYFPFIRWDHVIICSNKQMVRGDVMVDDGIHNLDGAECLKVLFDAPANRSFDAAKAGMVRVSDWEGAYAVITDFAKGGE